jgi:tryptophan halogenase
VQRYKHIVVVGAGSAGFLAALTLQQVIPDGKVTIVRSPKIPVIGVGESTTPAIPAYLHKSLGIDALQFIQEVDPVWKLGNRFYFGDPDRDYFDYAFEQSMSAAAPELRKSIMYYLHAGEMRNFCLTSGLMDQKRSPFFPDPEGKLSVWNHFGYHIDNEKFLAHLEKVTLERGVEIVEADVCDVRQASNGDITHLIFESGGDIEADFFADCSGFRGQLIKQVYDVPFVSFNDRLYCDRAVIASWDRDHPIEPFTTSISMNNGWCWNIELQDRITRGYVHSSAFCSEDEAVAELQAMTPQVGDDVRTISFPSGRLERHWVNNVVAIGNSSGFVEPIEATALLVVTDQLKFVSKALLDSYGDVPDMMRDKECERVRVIWDDICDFIVAHYKFNRHIQTPFWEHCHAECSLGGAEEFYEYFKEVGPSALAARFLPPESVFGFEGYMNVLLGLRAPTNRPPKMMEQDWQQWGQYASRIEKNSLQALTTEQAIETLASGAVQSGLGEGAPAS